MATGVRKKRKASVDSRLCVAETVIVGQVPQTWFQTSLRLLLSLRKLLGCTIDELLIGTDTESKGNG